MCLVAYVLLQYCATLHLLLLNVRYMYDLFVQYSTGLLHFALSENVVRLLYSKCHKWKATSYLWSMLGANFPYADL